MVIPLSYTTSVINHFLIAFSEPEFLFGKTLYEVDESDGNLEVVVHRSGRDLSFKSYVIFATRQAQPVSAKGMLSENYSLCSVP